MRVAEVLCKDGPRDTITAIYVPPPGEFDHPLPGDYALLEEAPGTGVYYARSFEDPTLKIDEPAPGEKVLISRSASGVLAAKFHLRADGSIMANGAKITKTGNVITSTGVDTDNHTHATTVGPTAKATPGIPPT